MRGLLYFHFMVVPPRLDKLYKPELQVAAEVGESARFTLRLFAHPPPNKVTWMKDSKVGIRFSGVGRSTLSTRNGNFI